MKKFIIFFILFLLTPLFCLAQVDLQEMFKAEVISVLEEQEYTDDYGTSLQQNLELKVLEGNFKGQEVVFTGIGSFQTSSGQVYKEGDRVIVSYTQNIDGQDVFYVLDYDRSSSIIWLFLIFIFSILAIGKWKGLRSLIALVISFFVILKFIIPQILNGANPVVISVIGSIIILLFAIYLTQGFNRKAHIANVALIVSLVLTTILSLIFTKLAQLTGYSGEETIYLLESGLNLQGLLLAGILIGTLGVLDDIIISQISTVEQIKEANPTLSKRQVYRRSLKVGIDHITSMINTLFFAYAGASLPLLILFTSSKTTGLSFSQVMNNEIIATEIIRTLLGSIGIVLAIPIANYLASYWLKVKVNKQQSVDNL